MSEDAAKAVVAHEVGCPLLPQGHDSRFVTVYRGSELGMMANDITHQPRLSDKMIIKHIFKVHFYCQC